MEHEDIKLYFSRIAIKLHNDKRLRLKNTDYAPNRCLYIKVTKLTMCNLSLGCMWGVQRCHTYKIAVSKYSKSTACSLQKNGGGWRDGCEPRFEVIVKMQTTFGGGIGDRGFGGCEPRIQLLKEHKGIVQY